MLVSCSSEEQKKAENEIIESIEQTQQAEEHEGEVNNINEKIEDFRSELRKGKTDWSQEETYTDTLELIEYNDELDYIFAKFKNKNGEEFQLNSDVSISNYYRGRNHVVKWKVGKYYEAGEDDAIYYQEKLVAAERLTNSFSFEKFLNKFSETYSKGNQEDIKKSAHPFEDIVTTYKNGLYCVKGKPEFISEISYLGQDYIITSEKPSGDFCGGYEDAKDGLYYEFFDESKELQDLFPSVNDMNREGVEMGLYVTEDIIYQYFAKVLVIAEGNFNRALYFFLEDGQWYFWVEDFCDCSA